jgi:excisionase family DNA binding protein
MRPSKNRAATSPSAPLADTSHAKLAAEAVAHLPKLCTQEQVQATLNISPRTMGRYVVDGTIPAVRFGGVVRIPKSALVEFIVKGLSAPPHLRATRRRRRAAT